MEFSRIAVLGAGNMGTALAQILALRGRKVRLWDYNPETVEIIARKGINDKFLPGVKLSKRILPEVDMVRAVERAQLVIVACASPYVRSTVKQLVDHLKGKNAVIANVAKGLEDKTNLTMHEVVQSELPVLLRRRVVTISGPSIAKEFATGVPTAVVAASQDKKAAEFVREVFEYRETKSPMPRRLSLPTFRIAISKDWKGVNICGALKNVYAIALGMCDPVRARGRLGQSTSNGTAWMFTLVLEEMERVVVAFGGKRETVYGFAGIGDLVVTGLGQGRNRALGERICKAGHCRFIWDKNSGTVEGVAATQTFYKLCQRKKISAPIIKMVYEVLYNGADPCRKIAQFFSKSLL